MNVRAPAKLNLFLRVLGPAADGFHDIETLFLRLALSDELEIRPGAEGIRLRVDGPMAESADGARVPADERNLCWRAAASFHAAIGEPPAVEMQLTKRIPVAAGLGGGSSDAATVLTELNRRAGRPLSSARLLELAAGLGSDVPFFASGAGAAIGRGRGERLTRARCPSPRPVLVLVPTFGVSAASAYRWWAEDAREGPPPGGPPPVELPGPDEAIGWEFLARVARNDLAGPVGRRHPELAEASARLISDGADIALLCGSGSCVAGVFREENLREEAASAWNNPPPPFGGWTTISTWTDAGPG